MNRDDAFTARNRAKIPVLIALATFNYWLATCIAAIAAALTITFAILAEASELPDTTEQWKWLGIGLLGIVVISAVVGSFIALFRLPMLRRRLEQRVLSETSARFAGPDDDTRVSNLLEGLAIAAGVPAPRFAVVEDAAPNSFSVGTRPAKTIVAVTTGLVAQLTRDELEAVLAYEVSRIDSMDVALASWTVALTGSAIAAVDDEDGGSGLGSILGFIPRRLSQRLQVWALRDQAAGRDRAAIAFTKNPAALVRALEKLDADRSEVSRVSRSTAPLWVEFPARMAGTGPYGRKLGASLALSSRIDELRRLAGLVASNDG